MSITLFELCLRQVLPNWQKYKEDPHLQLICELWLKQFGEKCQEKENPVIKAARLYHTVMEKAGKVPELASKLNRLSFETIWRAIEGPIRPEDLSFIIFFNHVKKDPAIKELPHPQLTGKRSEDLKRMKEWLIENKKQLAKIKKLDFEKTKLTHVPEELRLLTGLSELRLSNKIESFPEKFRIWEFGSVLLKAPMIYCNGVWMGESELFFRAIKEKKLDFFIERERQVEEANN